MTESNDSPSLFSDEELPKKKVTRRKTVKAVEAAEEPVKKTRASRAKAAETASDEPKAAPRTRRTKATAAAAEPESEEKPKARRTTKKTAEPAVEAAPAEEKPRKRTTKAKATEEVSSEAVEAKPRRVTRKSVKEEPAEPAAPVKAAEQPAEPVRKPRTRAAAKPAAPSVPVRPPGEIPAAEEWTPGKRASAEIKAPVEPTTPSPAAPETEERAPRRPFAYEQRVESREGREPREQRENREPRDHRESPREGSVAPRENRENRDNREGGASGPREHREKRFNRRDRHHRRDRDHRGNRNDRGDRYDRGERSGGGDSRERQDRDQRIASARQEFASQSFPEPDPNEPPVFAEGIIEVSGKGFGFLRDPKRNFAQHPNDIFVTPEVCRRYPLRDGMWIKGEIRRGNRGMQLYKLTEIEGEDPEKVQAIPMFEELTTVNPNRFIRLETTPERYTTRVIDLMAPIGRGQRGLIVAPPRTGKTTLLQHVAEALCANHPDMKLIILLVDERPEEVTEIRRSVPGAEVMASSNDMDLKSHTRIAQFAIERAKRLVEMGKHVFVLLDSITRVGRAFNNATSGGGRTMSGGVDARALEIPRKLFAAARNTEEAGSLTIVATALIDTGSRMDELIFQEFKGTGNMELVLDRRISDLRVYPAVDIFQSGTRREELLLPETDLHKINIIRRGLAGHKPAEAIERLLSFLRKFPTNAEMLREIPG